MPKYLVRLEDGNGNGNASEFIAANEGAAVIAAKEKFGPDFSEVIEVTLV